MKISKIGWSISDEMKELTKRSAVYGMLGQIYCVENALREYRKDHYRLSTGYQQTYKRLFNYVDTIFEKSKAIPAELNELRRGLLLVKNENRYDHSDMVQNWEVSYDYLLTFHRIIEEIDQFEEEILECLDSVKKMQTRFCEYKGLGKVLYSTIITSWAGLGGFTASIDLISKGGLYAFGGAILGNIIVRLIDKCTSCEERTISNSLEKMKAGMKGLLFQRKEFAMFITPMIFDIENYESIAFRLSNPSNLSAGQEKLNYQTAEMLKETDMLQVHFQRIEKEAKQVLANLEESAIDGFYWSE